MEDLFDGVRALPCGSRLLAAATDVGCVHLVGGAVRDLLLGRAPRELDVVVEGDVAPLAAALGGELTGHERFGTATVRDGDCRLDLARARAERYAHPGALPDVRPAGIDEDLLRRDVTVNAIALDLSDGALRAAPHALADLAAGRLRVLHDRSLHDDPTRLWRLARYGARLGFALEEHTASLVREAVAGDALATVSGERVGAELRLALAEPDPVTALMHAAAMGLAGWLDPDADRADRARALLPASEGREELVVLGACLGEDEASVRAALGALGLDAHERRVLEQSAGARALAARVHGEQAASRIARAFAGLPVEVVAVAGAHGAGEQARRFLGELRHVRLAIGGDDLVAAGIARGPDVGRRLAATLEARLDGEVGDDRAAQLAVALA
jgi:tRNA nucleotidyltransferase (CCA-adding enzyme)